MENMNKYLKGNPLPWLLEPDNPSVRYWTLVYILGQSEDAVDVQEARKAIMQQPLVKELFALQHPEGYWGVDESKPYTANGAVGALSLLHMLAVPPDSQTASGCNSFLKFCQHECGGFSLVKKTRSGIFPCTTGQHLPFLTYFGFGDDPRVRLAFSFLIDEMSADKAFNCGRYQHRECLWGVIAVLNGLSVIPVEMKSPRVSQLVSHLADMLLNAGYDFNGEHKRWLTLGVPRAWDLLSMLKVLAFHGYGKDPRFTPLLKLLLSLQNDEGRWLCGSTSRTWPLEKRNQPSKWVTLDALRMLKLTELI
jgi:hypothetical protein